MRTKRIIKWIFSSLLLVLFFTLITVSSYSQVKVWEEDKVIKTYLQDPPDVNPRFYEGIGHQGVQRHVYPFAMNDHLTDESEMKAYHTIYMENEYIKISIIPELGGRIFSAYDKVADYNYIYDQDAIKPALIGMVGAWTTGAIAWGFPHHHGPHTIAPYEHTINKNSDGSVTVWISRFDLRHRLKGLLGITLHPDDNVLSVSASIHNPTPYTNSFLWFTNPSVRADESYQIIFDPSVEWVTYHKKDQMLSWPIADDWYHGVDYRGVDISRWNNIKRPTSFFTLHPEGDHFGGYSFKYDAGIAFVGNHHLTPGMKCWEYGPNPEGDAWIRMVTDNAGHNIEIMAGAYSDNQPDYSWIQPYEVKHFTQNWFPISQIEGLDYANLEGAVNIDVEGDQAKIRINSTSLHENASLLVTLKGETIINDKLTISPKHPFKKDLEIEEGVLESDMRVLLMDDDGNSLLDFQHVPKANKPRPVATVLPGEPEDYNSVEELYLAGRRLVQFYDAVIDSKPYFEEALKRDPGNYNVNSYLGMEDVKHKRWEEAEEKLQKAVDRITYNNTRPMQCDAHYYLGIAKRKLGKDIDAYNQFYRATWDYSWNTAGYSQLAEMDFLAGDYARANMHLDRAISTNSLIQRLKVNKAIALRKMGQEDKAEKIIRETIKNDLLDFFARNELIILQTKNNPAEAKVQLEKLTKLMRDDEQNYMEISSYYSNLGLYPEAVEVLERITKEDVQGRSVNPILYYTLAYLFHLQKDDDIARKYLETATNMPWEYCFPWREESIPVLEYAKKTNASDAKASYFLGCLIYDMKPERGIKEWEYSASIDNQYAYTFRNLAWGYMRYEKDINKAIVAMEKAVEFNNQDARFYYELDQMYEKAGLDINKRVDKLVNNHDVVKKRDDALSREALVLIQVGSLDEAIQIYEDNHFNFWEGVGTVISIYQDALVMRGIQRFKEKNYDGALEDFELSWEYPPNIDMGKPHFMSRFAELYYYTGLALEKLGRKKEAEEYFTKAINASADGTQYLYYEGMAHEKLKNKEAAENSFKGLYAYANREQKFEGNTQFSIRVSEEQWRANNLYANGLYQMAKENKVEAKKYFEKAVETNPHVWASFWLEEEF